MMDAAAACPCGSKQSYARCCQPLHHGAPAPSAEALMRSRYSAYVAGLDDYILQTWHPSRRPASLDAGDGATTRWLGLQVKRHEARGDDGAIVEFVARYRVGGGSAVRLHEISRFVREEGRWFYLDGDFPQKR